MYWPECSFLLPYLFQAKIDLRAVFESLSQDEQDAILDPKGTNKLPTKDTNKPNPPSNATAEQTDAAELKDSSSQREPSVSVNEPENIDVCYLLPCPCYCVINTFGQSENTTPKARPRKAGDPEKAAKVR